MQVKVVQNCHVLLWHLPPVLVTKQLHIESIQLLCIRRHNLVVFFEHVCKLRERLVIRISVLLLNNVNILNKHVGMLTTKPRHMQIVVVHDLRSVTRFDVDNHMTN